MNANAGEGENRLMSDERLTGGSAPRATEPSEVGLQPALSSRRDAAFICDSTLHVYASSAEASGVLSDGISIEHGRIGIADVLARRRLLQILRRDCAGEAAVEAMLVPRPSGKPSWQLVLARFSASTCGPAHVGLWHVEVADPSAVRCSALQLIMKMYELTPAEARLAQQLMAGATVQEAAAETQLKLPTIRSQLGNLLRKTGARRQAELVRLFSVIPA